MRLLAAIPCTLALTSLSACTGQDYTALPLANSGFEEASGGGRIAGWSSQLHVDASAYETVVDSSVATEGRSSARIRQLRPQVFGSIGQVVPLPADAAGRTLRLRAAVRSESAQGKGMSLSLQFGGLPQSPDPQYSAATRGSTDWHEVVLLAKVPQGAKDVNLRAVLQGDGTGWVDAVHLELENQPR